jgi:hypothetical protein
MTPTTLGHVTASPPAPGHVTMSPSTLRHVIMREADCPHATNKVDAKTTNNLDFTVIEMDKMMQQIGSHAEEYVDYGELRLQKAQGSKHPGLGKTMSLGKEYNIQKQNTT